LVLFGPVAWTLGASSTDAVSVRLLGSVCINSWRTLVAMVAVSTNGAAWPTTVTCSASPPTLSVISRLTVCVAATAVIRFTV
jgi:hypothetical protein